MALANLESQLTVAEQITGAGRMKAEAEASFYNLVLQGVPPMEAQRIASEQLAINQANATANVERQIEALNDSTRLMKAGEGPAKARVAAAIAEKNALNDGADAQSAAALKAAVYANEMTRAAKAAREVKNELSQASLNMMQAQLGAGSIVVGAQIGMDYSEWDAYNAAGGHRPDTVQSGAYSYLSDPRSEMGTMEISGPGPFAQAGAQYLRMAAGDEAIPSALRDQLSNSDPINYNFQQNLSEVPINGVLKTLEDLRKFVVAQDSAMRNAEAQFLGGSNNNADKIRGMELQIEALREGLDRNPENIWPIRGLERSIEELRNSVEENTDALNKVTLNPLYTEGRSALKLGYMGAADGLDMMVKGGIPGVDSVPIHIMAQQGERVQVKRPGEAAASNDNNSKPALVVNNTINVTESKSGGRRSSRQVGQKYGQLMASLS